MADYSEMILRFFREDIGGILITDAAGEILYSDPVSDFVREDQTNWFVACPVPRIGQKAEPWDLTSFSKKRTVMVLTSTVEDSGKLLQIHELIDITLYITMCRDISRYTKQLRESGDRDSMTGLFNNGKFTSMKNSLFREQETIAIYNMDINNLKEANDAYGHRIGDRLIRRAAESLKQISARNIMPFRVGGDEFVVVAIHVNRAEAEAILRKWEQCMAGLNQSGDGPRCEVACGFVFSEAGYDLEELLARADRLMYENKKALKGAGNIR